MIASLCCALFYLLYLTSGCIGNPDFNIDEYRYEGYPIGISCIYSEDQKEFHQAKVNGTQEIPTDLIQNLNNGKKMSLYFDGIGSHIKPNGSTFNFVMEWFKASDSNICYITYAYENVPNTFNTLVHATMMVTSHRLQYAAKVARDLYLRVRAQCIETNIDSWLENTRPKKTTLLGFSFGAHIASEACHNIYDKTKEKVGRLIGEDPAGIYLLLQQYNQRFIGRGDASYVQIIHTDSMIFGTMYSTGDVDILVYSFPAVHPFKKHELSVYLHMATCIRKLILVAAEEGNGRVIVVNPESGVQNVPAPQEVFLGVYSELRSIKPGTRFQISLDAKRMELVRKSIEHVITMH